MPYVREYGVLSANATADVDRQKSRSWTDIMATLLAAGVKFSNELHIPRLELDSRKCTHPKYYVRSTPYIFCMYSVCSCLMLLEECLDLEYGVRRKPYYEKMSGVNLPFVVFSPAVCSMQDAMPDSESTRI